MHIFESKTDIKTSNQGYCKTHTQVIYLSQQGIRPLDRKDTTMSKETEDLIKLIASADDPDKAALTAFAILLDYLKHRESLPKASASRLQVTSQTSLPS